MPETGYEGRFGAVLVALLIAAAAFVVGRDGRAGGDGVSYWLRLSRPAGLKEGAPIRISGQDIGIIRTVGLERRFRTQLTPRGPIPVPDYGVKLELFIFSPHHRMMRQGAQFYIEAASILAEPHLDVDPGAADAAPLDPRRPIDGVNPPTMDSIMEKTYNSLLVGSALLKEEGPRLAAITASGSSILTTLNGIDPGFQRTRQVQARLKQIQVDAAGLMLGVSSATDDGRRLRRLAPVAQRLMDKTNAAIKKERVRLEQALESVQALQKTFGPEQQKRMQATLDGLMERDRKRLMALLKRTNQIFADLKDGKGTLGALGNDTELFDEVKALSKILKRRPWKVMVRPPGAGNQAP